MKKKVQIFATDKHGDRKEIDDLYWFEEQGIHDFSGEAHYDNYYHLEIFIDDERVYP